MAGTGPLRSTMGGHQPTRLVCSAEGGQNDHLLENVSQVLEPVANLEETGLEVTSTPDMVSVITDINGRERYIIEEDLAKIDKEMRCLMQLIVTILTTPPGQRYIQNLQQRVIRGHAGIYS